MQIRVQVLALAWLAAFAVAAGAQIFGADAGRQARYNNVDCAAKKMQLFFYYYDPARKAEFNDFTLVCGGGQYRYHIPRWFEDNLPSMMSKKAWRDPVEGDLSEANLWQTPISLLYSFFDLTKRTFPARDKFEGGQGIPPGLLIKEYADIRVRYQMSLDRIYRAHQHDAMNGRGRTLMSYYDSIMRQMEAVAESISSNNNTRFNNAVNMTATFSQGAFSQLFGPPRHQKVKVEPSPLDEYIPVALKLLGVLVIFFGVRKVIGKDDEGFNRLAEDYMTRVTAWTDAFNRQFLRVRVQYLVMTPVVVFMIGGAFSGSLLAFFGLTGMGLYLGLHMPMWVLNSLKLRRGRKIDVQLMDAIILLSNSLKSGLDIVQGFDLVARDLQAPISEEFGLVIKNYQLGATFERAMEGMEERVASRLLAYMIRAIVLQRQVGGNLTKIFERIVDYIREESKLEEKVKSLTAQQKIQSIVVGIMPWIMLGIMFMFQGELMSKFYFTPIGAGVLFFCAVWIAIGMKVVQSLGNIKV
ncbi:MAG: type II secretion system F family protein [Elusimicrobiales bacterium]